MSSDEEGETGIEPGTEKRRVVVQNMRSQTALLREGGEVARERGGEYFSEGQINRNGPQYLMLKQLNCLKIMHLRIF